jgi:hypothetical protein
MTLTFVQNMGGAFLIVLLLFSLAYFVLWLYCLIDVIRSNFKDQNMKIIWVIVLLFAHVLGPIAYLILGRGSKTT